MVTVQIDLLDTWTKNLVSMVGHKEIHSSTMSPSWTKGYVVQTNSAKNKVDFIDLALLLLAVSEFLRDVLILHNVIKKTTLTLIKPAWIYNAPLILIDVRLINNSSAFQTIAKLLMVNT